jgi:hypothetical protein
LLAVHRDGFPQTRRGVASKMRAIVLISIVASLASASTVRAADVTYERLVNPEPQK